MRYLTPDELKKTNKEEAKKALEHCAGKNVKYNFALNVFSKYAQNIGSGKNAHILDIGTASGAFPEQLNQKGYQNLYGHDIDEYIPTKAKSVLKEYKLSDLGTEKIPWGDNTFDIITAWCVLPHLENPFFAGREIKRTLKPGGIFIFTTPHITSKPSIDFFLKKGYFASYRPTNNHIALLPQSVLEKTVFQGFRHIGTEYLVTPKVYRGWRGKIRKVVNAIATKNQKWGEALAHRWAYNVCYVIQKEGRE